MEWSCCSVAPCASAGHGEEMRGEGGYEESRCSNEIRINVRLTLHLGGWKGVPVFIFYLALHLSTSHS